MANDVCDTCGLPDELCVCEDVSRDEAEVKIRLDDDRKYNKEATLVEGLPEETDVEDLASQLKSQCACGGTAGDSHIMLQGDHRDEVRELLRERGFSVSTPHAA